MKSICLAVLWHQHQPSYRPGESSIAALPWARLHGIKDYVGMALLAERYPDFHHTINLVPCLLDQLEALAAGEATDADLELTRKAADELTPGEATAMLESFFAANIDTMIRPHRRYAELFGMRRPDKRTAAEALREFDAEDLRDLQMWHLLAWFHPLVVEARADVRALLAKGERFTEADKEAALKAQAEVLAQIIPRHRGLQEAGIAELTTSPYYHPILPLLLNMESARVAVPGLPLPAEPFRAVDDAAAHLAEAVRSHERRFGRGPRGMWPSEGSVSADIVGPVLRAGISWMASDEDVLGRSLGLNGRGGADAPAPDWLYGPYEVSGGSDGKLVMVFRDHVLSDRIGFQYARWPSGEQAAADLLARIRAARPVKAGQPPLVAIIMDGENAWEFYPGQAMAFLTAFYSGACRDERIRPVTVSEYLDSYGPVGRIERLYPGSWIGANFATWVGQTEKNRAWELLARAKAAVEDAAREAEPESIQEARDAIRKAEGSDWFWWYGEDHSSAQEDVFDRLFRAHLREAYERAGLAVRDEVEGAITEERPLYMQPRFLTKVAVDGWVTSYYEWLGAGYYDTRRDAGAMRPAGGRAISQLFFGYSLGQFFLRLDPERHTSGAYGLDWSVRVAFSNGRRAVLPQGGAADGPVALALRDAGSSGWERRAGSAAYGKVLELGVPWEDLGLKAGDEVTFYVEILRGDDLIQRLPYESAIGLTVPAAGFGEEDWSA
jgi:alpha-amylase/alpha-mannosidase (GH57 family)